MNKPPADARRTEALCYKKVSLKNPEPHENSEAFTTWLSSFLVKWYWKATRKSVKNLVHPFQKTHGQGLSYYIFPLYRE